MRRENIAQHASAASADDRDDDDTGCIQSVIERLLRAGNCSEGEASGFDDVDHDWWRPAADPAIGQPSNDDGGCSGDCNRRIAPIAEGSGRMFAEQQIAHDTTAGRPDECEYQHAEQVEVGPDTCQRALNCENESSGKIDRCQQVVA